jgi:hypothetical protein
MPGLIRGVARTAAVVGTATAVSNRVSRRQANRWAEQDQQAYAEQAPQQYAPAPQYAAPPPQYAAPAYAEPQYTPPPAGAAAPAAAPADDTVTQLTKLADLKAQGILTDAEFEAAKAKVLGG